MNSIQATRYGVLLGSAAATATATGFALQLGHIGWVVAATLLVMRPKIELQKWRTGGRVISVVAGALVASWLLSQNMQPLMIASFCAGAIIAASATHASRWYITPAFTTF